MNHIKPSTAGLVLGTLFAIVHVVWSVLVWVGWAQMILDFVFLMHMVTPILTVEDFSLSRALMLVVIAACIGYVIGGIFAVLWNKMHRAEARALR